MSWLLPFRGDGRGVWWGDEGTVRGGGEDQRNNSDEAIMNFRFISV
jgi:hypothetical protein